MTMGTLGTHKACMLKACSSTYFVFCLCRQVERDAYKAESDAYKAENDALKRKCEELRQDLESVMLHACKGPFGKGPMPDDVDDDGHEDKKAKSERKQVNDVKFIFKQHAITKLFAGQQEHHGNMLPESPPESPAKHITTLNAGGSTFPTSIKLSGGIGPTFSMAAADMDSNDYLNLNLNLLLGNDGSANSSDGTFPTSTFSTSIELPGSSKSMQLIPDMDDRDIDDLLSYYLGREN